VDFDNEVPCVELTVNVAPVRFVLVGGHLTVRAVEARCSGLLRRRHLGNSLCPRRLCPPKSSVPVRPAPRTAPG